jgi:hypothetical protein
MDLSAAKVEASGCAADAAFAVEAPVLFCLAAASSIIMNWVEEESNTNAMLFYT